MKKMMVVLDASGSMGEVDKKSLARYVLYALEGLMQGEFSDIQYECYKWGKEIDNFKNVNEVGFEECINDNDIIAFLEKNEEEKFLFITDGNFQRTLINKMATLINNKNLESYALAVGDDCNVATLRKIFQRENVYDSYDIATCIRNLLCN